MKQVYQADWDKVMEKYHFDPRNEELLLKTAQHGFWGKTFTTDPLSLLNVMVVRGYPNGKIDVSFKFSSEEDTEALLNALENEKSLIFCWHEMNLYGIIYSTT
ncbi:hypothetical protein FJZ31_06115 [Candidatus Poribacteria bacterium]|nr:hypothetical protein [Candidatus Poribacteria bacterium]